MARKHKSQGIQTKTDYIAAEERLLAIIDGFDDLYMDPADTLEQPPFVWHLDDYEVGVSPCALCEKCNAVFVSDYGGDYVYGWIGGDGTCDTEEA